MQRRSLLAAMLAAPATARAQHIWRAERPFRLVVPFAPGGALDITARLLAREMEPALGQPIVVENRSGAGGNVGAEAVARAAPDGYTFLISSPGPLAVNQFVFPSMPYDPETAFSPVVHVVINPVVILGAPQRPERSFADFLATVRSGRPVNYSTSGSGGAGHMAMEVLKARLSLPGPQHVPFRGAGPSLQALAGAQVEFAIESITSAAGSISAGAARPLALTTSQRWRGLPDVPTVQESGVPDFDFASWTSFVYPRGVPAGAVLALNSATNLALAKPDVQARLFDLGASPVGGTAEDLDRFIRSEREKWREAVRISGARAD